MRTLRVALVIAAVAGFASEAVLAQEQNKDVPDDAAVKAAEKIVRDIFKTDYAKRGNADRQALAKNLLKQGIDTKDDAAARYVLFRESQEIAAKVGDIETALRAIDEMSRSFSVNAVSLKSGALAAAAGGGTPEEQKVLAQAWMSLAEEATKARQFDAAAKAAQGAIAAAKKAKDLLLLNKADAQSKSTALILERSEKAMKALEALKADPDVAEANQAVGEFECFVLGDWDAGLPKLAKGADPILKALAGRELSKPTDGVEQSSLGDAWWDRAEKESGVLKSTLRRRAGFWYDQAYGNVTGLAKAKVDKRLEELGIFKGRPPGAPGSIDITTLKIKKSTIGAGALGVNSHDDSEPLIVHAKACTQYIFAHAPSTLTFDIPPGVRFFQATGVKLRSRVEGSWKYFVIVDGKTLYESGVLSQYPGCEVDMLVAIPPGAKELLLKIDDCGSNNGDHSVWAYPRFQK